MQKIFAGCAAERERKMKGKNLFVMVCLVFLLIGISACSSTSNSTTDFYSNFLLMGSWESVIGVEDYWNDNAGAEAEFFDPSGLSVTVDVEFKADESFTWKINEESLEDYNRKLRSIFQEGLEDYGNYVLAQENPGMTFSEALDRMGMTEDEFLDEMMRQTMDSIDTRSFGGTYLIDGDTLYLTYTEGADTTEALKFECTEDYLVIDIEEDYTDSMLSYLLPMTYTRKK